MINFGKKWIPAGVAVLFAAGAFSGCSEMEGYSGQKAVILPAHIQKVAIRPFVNKTQFFGLEDKLRLRLEQEYIRDGRIPFVNNESQADGVLQGEIVNYIKQVVTYDANNQPLDYKLWVIMNIRFVDMVNKSVLWEEPRLEQEYQYFVETQPGGKTEEEAREVLWDLFSRDIVKRTMEGFGSVSGASERKVSKDPLPLNGDMIRTEPATTPAPPPPPPPPPDRLNPPPSPY